MANLRVIYNNLANLATTTITASSTAGVTSTANLKKDTKSLIWRSGTSATTNVKANLVITNTAAIIGGVVLPFSNLTPQSTIRVRGYTGAAPTMGGTIDVPTTAATGTLMFDTGVILAAPYQALGLWTWGTIPLGVNSYSYGGGTYGRAWVPGLDQKSCTSLLIEIVDINPSKYIEISRVVVGSYWSPRYNTAFGLSTGAKDLSAHERTESGDLVTNRGATFNSISFDLQWLTGADRLDFSRIVRGNGMPTPLLISLFPNDTDAAKEQAHQVYGKLSSLSDITHPIFDMYSTNINLEEI
jgi:hypothetical protein